MICDKCKNGTHERGPGCKDCWPGIPFLGAYRLVWPDPNCTSCGGFGLGCKGGTWCDCQHKVHSFINFTDYTTTTQHPDMAVKVVSSTNGAGSQGYRATTQPPPTTPVH